MHGPSIMAAEKKPSLEQKLLPEYLKVYDLPSPRNDVLINIDEKTRNAGLRFYNWKLIVGSMPDAKNGRKTQSKGICAALNKSNTETEVTTSETDSGWKSPCKLKQDVQTIIDIMGPPLSPNFYNNTSSEADNEESIFSNSKLSSEKVKVNCLCDEVSEKTNTTDIPTKEEANLSTAAEVNTATLSATIEDLTDSKVNFPYVEDFCRANQYICPPPLIPANVCVNSECFCPQVASILHGQTMMSGKCKCGVSEQIVRDVESNIKDNKSCKSNKDSKNVVINWLKAIVSSSLENERNKCKCEYYKMDVKRKRGDNNSPPRRVVFELVEDLPKNTENDNINCGLVDGDALKNKKNVKNERLQTKADLYCCDAKGPALESRGSKKPIEKTMYSDSSGNTRVDVYYFDHGSFNHYQTTDAPPLVTTEQMADKTEKHTTRFWAEIFGTIHIGFSFVTSFVLQFFKFLLYSICRPLTIGLIQLGSDYCFKPLLVTIFNGVIQPILIFVHNIMASIRDLCDPISEGIGYFLRELSVLVRAFRIVEVTNENFKCQADCKCEKKAKKSKIMS